MAKKIAFSSVLLLLFSVLTTTAARTNFRLVQDSSVSTNGICKLMVEPQGYSCEEHKVTTKDGYILSMQRIPTGRTGGTKNGAKTPVVLQHGIFADASTWVSNSPDESLGFILADSGYDVWLANVRGTNSSLGHTSLSPKDPAYWNWSWDELAAYDLPAYIQHVYDQTGQKSHYVGHSLGTLMAVGAFAKQEVLSLVRSAVLLSPIAYLGHMPSPLTRAAADIFLGEVIYWLGVKEFPSGGGGGVSKLVDDICNTHIINCSDLESVFTGPNCCLNSSKSFLGNMEPTATKNLVHLAQMIRHGTIAMYDYGIENIKHYGKLTPPKYNMASIPNDLPLFLAYGGKDLISDVKDVHTLINSLADHDPDKLVELYVENYAHLDFVRGTNAKEVVYIPLMAFLKLN